MTQFTTSPNLNSLVLSGTWELIDEGVWAHNAYLYVSDNKNSSQFAFMVRLEAHVSEDGQTMIGGIRCDELIKDLVMFQALPVIGSNGEAMVYLSPSGATPFLPVAYLDTLDTTLKPLYGFLDSIPLRQMSNPRLPWYIQVAKGKQEFYEWPRHTLTMSRVEELLNLYEEHERTLGAVNVATWLELYAPMSQGGALSHIVRFSTSFPRARRWSFEPLDGSSKYYPNASSLLLENAASLLTCPVILGMFGGGKVYPIAEDLVCLEENNRRLEVDLHHKVKVLTVKGL